MFYIFFIIWIYVTIHGRQIFALIFADNITRSSKGEFFVSISRFRLIQFRYSANKHIQVTIQL